MFHPDLHEQDPQAFILKQGWGSVSLDSERGLKELRALYEHLQARILEIRRIPRHPPCQP